MSSSRLLKKQAKSSPSVFPPPSGPRSARRCWMTTLNGLVGIVVIFSVIVASTSLSSQRAVLIHQFDDGHRFRSGQPPPCHRQPERDDLPVPRARGTTPE